MSKHLEPTSEMCFCGYVQVINRSPTANSFAHIFVQSKHVIIW